MNDETEYCPVVDAQIDSTMCLEITDVADRLLSPSIFEDYPEDFPKKFVWNEEQRKKRRECKWHDYQE